MPSSTWHKRYHPLRREWIVYAAHRNQRPWSFDERSEVVKPPPAHDPNCYLCPGVERISGITNPMYDPLYVFDNDHPVVGENAPAVEQPENELLKKSRAYGQARVLCYHPRHDLTMASIPLANVQAVFRELRSQTKEFLDDPNIDSLLVFENKGQLVGASNPHPHCQLYALDFPVGLVSRYLAATEQHHAATKGDLMGELLAAELEDGRRIVASNEHAVAYVPFYARFAYEVMVMPRVDHATLANFNDDEIDGFAAVFQEVNRRYDLLYGMSFPYVMTLLQSPLDGVKYSGFRTHMLIQPPLRRPGLQKFLAGPETGADTFMADTMPEQKAAELRAVNLEDYDLTHH